MESLWIIPIVFIVALLFSFVWHMIYGFKSPCCDKKMNSYLDGVDEKLLYECTECKKMYR